MVYIKKMLKVWTGKKIHGLPEVLAYSSTQVVEEVASAEEADYLLIPHNWTHVRDNTAYLKQFEQIGKKSIVFWLGDGSEKVRWPNTIVFRTSGYKSDLASNEIIMPTVVEDLGAKYNITTRAKGLTPSVGFVGWARQTGFAALKSTVKNAFKSGPRKKGLYLRQKAVDILSHSSLIETNFILRTGYKTGSQDEFVKNMKGSDFALAPKGDGNYSGRFYEALSLGRLPLLIDTDCVLPLENEIDYDKFVLRVPYTQMEELPERISKFYNSLSDEGFRQAQVAAREAFQNYLNVTTYLGYVLRKVFLQKYER